MIDTDKYKGHTPAPWKMAVKTGAFLSINPIDMELVFDAPLLLEEVKRLRLKDCAITQAEHMRAQVGDNTWHYAMEVWLYPETHYWEVEDELALIESFISTNRDAWVKHWGEPSEVVRKRGEE